MTKNMNASGFRKLDVDALAEDQYRDDDEPETPGIGPDENEVTRLLQSNRLEDALAAALRNPPLKTHNQAHKQRACLLVCKVLAAHKTADIEGAIAKLDRENLDLLLKYVYKGFERPNDNSCSVLLAWHERISAVGGRGAIVRVFTDTKRL